MAESLRDDHGIHKKLIDECAICGGVSNLKLCAKCKQVTYCSKKHQKEDWKKHKLVCKKISEETDLAKTSEKRTRSMGVVRERLSTLSIDSDEVASNCTSQSERVMTQPLPESHSPIQNLFTSSETVTCESSRIDHSAELTINSETSSESSCSLPSHITRNTLNSTNSPDSCSTGGDLGLPKDIVESGSSEKFILESEDSQLQVPDYNAQKDTGNTAEQTELNKMPYFSVVESRNKALGEYVTKCLNAYGLCVIDNFLGDAKGTDILDEVVDMHDHGELKSGQLVNTASPKGEVRGDIITWVDGSELGCANINCLITSIDAIMLHCQKSLGQYHVKGRSKAMVAAYPGNATHFLRHVDNPSGDGRCVTCIYYLNKNWNSKVDGGLLRIFPEGSTKVANIEPKFDRLLFFWSDRRNPHEVLPAYRSRYAVTVWYYDEQERKRAVKKFKGRSNMAAKHKEVCALTNQEDLNQ